jgi:hypothetical protein
VWPDGRPPSEDYVARSMADLTLPRPLVVDAARRALSAGDPSSARASAGQLAGAHAARGQRHRRPPAHKPRPGARCHGAHRPSAQPGAEPGDGAEERAVPSRRSPAPVGDGLPTGHRSQQRRRGRPTGPDRTGQRPPSRREPRRARRDRRGLPHTRGLGGVRGETGGSRDYQPRPPRRLRRGGRAGTPRRPCRAEGAPVQLPDSGLHVGRRRSRTGGARRPCRGRPWLWPARCPYALAVGAAPPLARRRACCPPGPGGRGQPRDVGAARL